MADSKQIYVGSDHAGFSLKIAVLPQLRSEFPELGFEDMGCHSEASVHYPDFAAEVGRRVVSSHARGILICGTGIGMSIAANKIAGIRAAECGDVTSARLSREHNDANVLCFGSRLVGFEVAMDMCRAWLKTEFAGGRHASRVALIQKLEEGKGK